MSTGNPENPLDATAVAAGDPFERVPDDCEIRMSAAQFRWTLKWHGDVVRERTLREVRLNARDRRHGAELRRQEQR